MPYFFIISGRVARMPPPLAPGGPSQWAPAQLRGAMPWTPHRARKRAKGGNGKAKPVHAAGGSPARLRRMPELLPAGAAAARPAGQLGAFRAAGQGRPPSPAHISPPPGGGSRRHSRFQPRARQTGPAGTRRAREMRARAPRPLHSRPGAEGAAGMIAMQAGRRLGASRNRRCVVQETRASGSRCRPTADGPGAAAAPSPPAGAAPWRPQLPAPQGGRPQGI